MKKIWVTGHNGMVGSAITRLLRKKNVKVLTVEKNKLDLTNQRKVFSWIKKNKPDGIINAAGKVGGILHNSLYPAEFIYINMIIAANIVHGSYLYKVKRLINLGSACVYPKITKQPIKEDYLLTGPLEKTNEAYAIAKISAIKLCKFYNEQYGCNFTSLQPTNLFGINDNFDLKSSHVVPALLRRFHEAKIKNQKIIKIWGSGKAKREFMYVDDLADAIYFVYKRKIKNKEIINVGSNVEYSIKQLAYLIKNLVGFKGKIVFDKSKPDGTPRRIVDNNYLRSLGWKSKYNFEDSIKKTYNHLLDNYKSISK